MGNVVLYHGSDEIVEFPEIRKSKYVKNFSWGFYCTNNYDQAFRWAKKNRNKGIVNIYSFQPSENLKVKRFKEMTDEWLDFIAQCRLGAVHDYDIVEGPMADDTVWNYVNDFLNQEISRTAFWEIAKFKHPTHQISFHTLRALNCLKFEGSEIVDEK